MKRILASFLSLILLLSVIPPIPVVASEKEITNSKSISLATTSVFSGGDGSKSNPYQIANADQLNAVRENPSASYIQIADIDLSSYSQWKPIDSFSGVYDGNGHSISNMTILGTEEDANLGLFDTVKGTIKNVYLENANISGVGRNVGSITANNQSTIEKCRVKGTINVTCRYGGGICGTSGTVDSCLFLGECVFRTQDSSTISICGGIVGNGGKVVKCGYKGNLSLIGDYIAMLGGIAGMALSVTECCCIGDIFTSAGEAKRSCGGVGGIVGETHGRGAITDCYYEGTMSGTKYPCILGGIVGESDSDSLFLINCYSKCTLSASSILYTYLGGLVAAVYSSAGTPRVTSSFWPAQYSASSDSSYCISDHQRQLDFVNDYYGDVDNADFEAAGYNFDTVWMWKNASKNTPPLLQCIDYNWFLQASCEHSWGGPITTQEATCTESGQLIYCCTICGATLEYPIMPLGHDYVDGICIRCGKNESLVVSIEYVPSDNSVCDKSVASLDFVYSDTYFENSAYTYNHDLAKLSLGLTMATSCKEEGPSGELQGEKYLQKALEDMEFDSNRFVSKKFDNNTATDDTCAYAFSTKYIPELKSYLVPVIIRGANYGGEWVSNFHVSEGHISTYSYGFNAAADAVYEHLQSYVETLMPNQGSLDPGQTTPKIIYWVTGFSRGGAIANLVGAKLTAASNGGGSRIFVYTFATPATVKSTAYKEYKNIHNIVSEIDVVPRLPLKSWGYTRFGTTLYLPCHTSRGVQYDTLLSGMQYEFNRLMINEGGSFRNEPFYGQEIAIDLLLEYVGDLAPTTDEFEDSKIQSLLRGFLEQTQGDCTAEDIIYFLLEGHETEAAMLVNIINNIDNATVMQKIGYCQLAVNEVLVAMLTGDDTDAETILKGRILKVLLELLIRYDVKGYAALVFGSDCFDNYACTVLMIKDIVDNGLHSALLTQHWPESYLAWLNSSSPEKLFSTIAYKRVSIKCPVDVTVFDTNNTVVARVENDEVDTSLTNALLVSVNGNGEKDVYIPEDGTYRIVITAREDGYLDIVGTDYSFEHKKGSTACFFNLEMTSDQIFTATVSPKANSIDVVSNGKDIPADYLSDDTNDTVLITVNSIMPALVYGGGQYRIGDTVNLSVGESNTYVFNGWYSDGQLVSTDKEIFFTATDDKEFTAYFHQHDWNEPTYLWSNDNTQVTATRICKNDASHVETETVVTTAEISMPPTCFQLGETTYTAVFSQVAFETQVKTVANVEMVAHTPGNPVEENYVEPTTTTDGGYDIVIYCQVCNTELSRTHTTLPAEKHNWGEAIYTWADDNSTVTAFHTCIDCSKEETETVQTRSVVTIAATHEKEGEVVYTATFENPAFDTQMKVVAIPKLEQADLVNPFVDVKEGAYYYDAVLWAVNANPQITAGTSATTFSPNNNCTRAQVVTFLWRASGQPEPTKTDNPFKDVKEGAYYYKAVLWAVENGVTAGTSSTTFSPNQGCTRAQVVTFLWRTHGQPEPTSSDNPFKDVTGGYYYTAVLWAVENKITAGTSTTTFSPNQTCTRGQIVTFLYRDLAS